MVRSYGLEGLGFTGFGLGCRVQGSGLGMFRVEGVPGPCMSYIFRARPYKQCRTNPYHQQLDHNYNMAIFSP